MLVSKKTSFDAAHFLPDYPGKCSNMHGHHWEVEVAVEGCVGKDGMVIDFALLKEFLQGVEGEFDHKVINTTIAMPTAENIAIHIWYKFEEWARRYDCFEGEVELAYVRVWESEDSMVEYHGV